MTPLFGRHIFVTMRVLPAISIIRYFEITVLLWQRVLAVVAWMSGR